MKTKNKTCYLVTFHTPINFGAVLQAAALSNYLKSTFGLDVYVINFRSRTLARVYPIVRFQNSLGGIKAFLIDSLNLFNELSKRRKFNSFVKKNMKLTKTYRSFDELNRGNLNCDYLVTGSDQVFRPTRSFEERAVFYLAFSNSHLCKFSYAGSLGGVDISDNDASLIKQYLSSFDHISVREQSGVDCLKRIGIDSTLVLDPVFLLSKEEWQSFEKGDNFPSFKKEYILYYALIDDERYHHYVYCISKMLNLPVVVVGPVKRLPFKVSRFFKTCGPAEFLSLIKHSSLVLTSSFHGVSFSLIYQKQFLSLEEDDILKNRVENLLKSIGIDYLSFKDYLQLCKEKRNNYIDYELINERLKKLIDNSKAFLERCTEREK